MPMMDVMFSVGEQNDSGTKDIFSESRLFNVVACSMLLLLFNVVAPLVQYACSESRLFSTMFRQLHLCLCKFYDVLTMCQPTFTLLLLIPLPNVY